MNKAFVEFSKKAEINLISLAEQVKDGTLNLDEAAMMQADFVLKNHPHPDGHSETFRKQRNQIALQAGVGLRPEWL